MPVPRPDYVLTRDYLQLALDLDLPDVESDKIGYAEAKQRSEAARSVLMSLRGAEEEPEWMDDFVKLLEGGWPWRQAAYIAWAAMPRDRRQPRTQDELAVQHLGLTSDRAISVWRRKNPAIDTTIAALQSAPLWEHRRAIYEALVEVATNADYKGHADRKLALEMMGDYVPSAKLAAIMRRSVSDDLSDLSDDELAALERGLEEIRQTRNDDDGEEMAA